MFKKVVFIILFVLLVVCNPVEGHAAEKKDKWAKQFETEYIHYSNIYSEGYTNQRTESWYDEERDCIYVKVGFSKDDYIVRLDACIEGDTYEDLKVCYVMIYANAKLVGVADESGITYTTYGNTISSFIESLYWGA